MKFLLFAGLSLLTSSLLAEYPIQLDQKSYESAKGFLNTKIQKFELKHANTTESIQYLFALANRQHPKHEQGYLIKINSAKELQIDINLQLNDISVFDILLELLSISQLKVSLEDGHFVFSPQKAQQGAAANP